LLTYFNQLLYLLVERVSILAYRVGRCLLKELLIKSGINQVILADTLGISVQQINKYANDVQKMHIETAKNISYVLNCQIEDLYEWIEVGDNE
jgi:DNA-binding XRE family transcriptional regulator